MSAPLHRRSGAALHVGPADWRLLVTWLEQDGVISAEEAQRTIARCAQAESAQPALVRLASVSMRRKVDQKPLDIEALAQWLAAFEASAAFAQVMEKHPVWPGVIEGLAPGAL